MGTIKERTKADGSDTFYAEVRLKGCKPQRGAFRTRTLAKQWIQKTEADIRDGRYLPTAEARRRTVGNVIDRFIADWLPRYPKREQKQTALLLWWKQRVGHLYLSELTPSILAEGRDRLLAQKTVRGKLRSSSTVNRYLSAISKALEVAVREWEWLETNPMKRVTKPQEAPGRERFLTHEEKDRLLEACKTSRNKNLYPIVALAILTGVRFGELTKLLWADVDFDRRKITLRETKNGDTRVLPLTEEVEEIFKQCPSFGAKYSEPVFSGKKGLTGKRSKFSVREAFQGACKRAGLELRFHDLRHSAASFLAMEGATQGALMAILGHKSPAMVRRYAHYEQGHLAALLQKTNSKVLTQGKANEL